MAFILEKGKRIRTAAVAGMFYPDDKDQLYGELDSLLSEAQQAVQDNKKPKAIIVPHAGYIYSGKTAAIAYRQIIPYADQIKRIVLLGPSHRVAFNGIACTRADAYETPLGLVTLDQHSCDQLLELPDTVELDAAHLEEHALEVQLPFLQAILPNFTLVPLVVGDATADQVSQVLETLWGDEETLIVISSDLSHFHSYETAKSIDARTCDAIEHFRFEEIDFDDACGRLPVQGLLRVAREKKLSIKTLDLRNSGDTAGDRQRVVGYGAWALNVS